MAYTIVEYRPSERLMTAIYAEQDGGHSAYLILAIGIFRDMEGRGGENVLVPLHADDLQLSQSHFFQNRRTLNDRLPTTVTPDLGLFKAVADEGDGCQVHFSRETYKWVISE